jgi:hypothetical protein
LTIALGRVTRAHYAFETFFEFSVLLLKVKHLLVAIAQERVETLQVLLGTEQLVGAARSKGRSRWGIRQEGVSLVLKVQWRWQQAVAPVPTA